MSNRNPAAAMRGSPLAVACALLLTSVADLSAHAVVLPGEVETGAYQRYLLRVPNERDDATTRVTLRVPPGVRIVSFADVPGWSIHTEHGPDGDILSVTWTGELPVARFVELPFMAVNPAEPTRLKWDVVQRYADGLEMAWAGPADSSTPASFTEVSRARSGGVEGETMDGAPADGETEVSNSDGGRAGLARGATKGDGSGVSRNAPLGSWAAIVLSFSSLALSLTSLAVALRGGRRLSETE